MARLARFHWAAESLAGKTRHGDGRIRFDCDSVGEVKTLGDGRLRRSLQVEILRRSRAELPTGAGFSSGSACAGRQRRTGCRMRPNFGYELRNWTRLHQRRADRIAQKIVHDGLL